MKDLNFNIKWSLNYNYVKVDYYIFNFTDLYLNDGHIFIQNEY